MKKLMTATLVALTTSLLASSAFAAPVKVGVAAEPYPPFSSPDASGKWVGWEIEFMEAVCAEAKLECVLTPVAWDGIIPALTESKIDVIMSSMSITEERMKTIDFSNKYYNTPAAVAVAKGSGLAATPEGLRRAPCPSPPAQPQRSAIDHGPDPAGSPPPAALKNDVPK